MRDCCAKDRRNDNCKDCPKDRRKGRRKGGEDIGGGENRGNIVSEIWAIKKNLKAIKNYVIFKCSKLLFLK